MTFNHEQLAALKAPLDPRHVKPPPQGKYGEYIEGWHVIAEANRIFGFDGWKSTIDLIEETNREQSGDKWRIGYRCVVSVEAGGCVRCGAGHGQGFGKSLGDAIDSALKEAETDALKRAFRTFGNPFGLALYDKTKANVGVPQQDLPTGPINDETREWLANKIDSTGKPVGDFLKAFEATTLKAITYEQLDAAKQWIRDNRKAA